MLCTNCHKANAVYHYKTVINGEVHEEHLCADCAAKAKLNSLGSDIFSGGFFGSSPFGNSFWGDNSFFGDFFGHSLSAPVQSQKVCPFCGSTEREIARNGQVGCAQCYDTFSDILTPYIRRVHGSDTHKGKVPADAAPKAKARNELNELQQQLETAIKDQKYEDAAKLRDRINELKGGMNNE